MTKRCGYVALLGRANAGKSTLLNSLVGEKIAVVSRKPQTTRNRLLGIAKRGDAQIIFLDTPGIQKSKSKSLLSRSMNKLAVRVAEDADMLFYLVDVTVGWKEEDSQYLHDVLAVSDKPFAVIASKIDKQKRNETIVGLVSIREGLDEFFKENDFKSRQIGDYPMKTSAKDPECIDGLIGFIAENLPEGPWFYGEDDLTDMSEEFVCSELVREQVFRQIKKEVPFGCAVKVTSIEDKGHVVVVKAFIIVSEKSHKGIIIGSGGKMLKSIGKESRHWLEKHFDNKVFLDISVEVSKGWTDDDRMLVELANMNDEDF